MTTLDRRQLMSRAVGAAMVGGSLASGATPSPSHAQPPEGSTGAEDFWARVRADYDRPDEIINLEHGYWTEMARPVREAFEAHTMRINRDGAYYARRRWNEDKAGVEARLAGYLHCKPSELALTRNASEALQALIGGYRPLERGDAVLYADLDYGSVKQNFETLAASRGAEVVTIALPEPATYDGIISVYEQAVDEHPNITLIVLTHVSNQTGLVIPVREIVARMRERGVDVIVDAAHSWGQLDFTLDDLDADFVAFNLHKWIGAPLGAGALYIRGERLGDIARSMSQSAAMEDRTAGRVYFGTMNFATVLTVHDALDYNDQVGWARKAERLKALRDIWAEPARALSGLEVLTPTDPRLATGITSFRFAGKTSNDDNTAIVTKLLDEYGIFTVHRDAPAKGACVRVTPALSTAPEDCERLLEALVDMVG